MGSRTWIKVYCNKWLEGTLREETSDVRGVWIDLLVLAGSGQYGDTGEIKLSNGVGFTDRQIAEILHISPALWRRAKARFIETGRIIMTPRGAISITNWSKYQSEYERQKPYRERKAESPTPEPEIPLNNPPIEIEKESEKLQREVTAESYNELASPPPEIALADEAISNPSFKENIPTPVKNLKPITDKSNHYYKSGKDNNLKEESTDAVKGENHVKSPGERAGGRVTNGDRIEAFLHSNDISTIKAISEATGINPNMVNTTLHNGKGKRFLNTERGYWSAVDSTGSLSLEGSQDSPDSHPGEPDGEDNSLEEIRWWEAEEIPAEWCSHAEKILGMSLDDAWRTLDHFGVKEIDGQSVRDSLNGQGTDYHLKAIKREIDKSMSEPVTA